MYRAVTVWCLRTGVDLGDSAAVARRRGTCPLGLGADPDDPTVQLDGEDVADAIRTGEVSAVVSRVATNRRCAAYSRRPSAPSSRRSVRTGAGSSPRAATSRPSSPPTPTSASSSSTASEAARLARRNRELHGADDAAAVAATRDQVVRRDRDDATVSQFTEAADGVVTLDTSDLDFDGSVAAVVAVVDAARQIEAGASSAAP